MQRENKRFIIYYKELTHVVMEAEKSKICRADFWFEFKEFKKILCYGNIQNNVWPNIWAPRGLIKLTHKISH